MYTNNQLSTGHLSVLPGGKFTSRNWNPKGFWDGFTVYNQAHFIHHIGRCITYVHCTDSWPHSQALVCDQRNYTPRKLGTCTNSVYGLSFLLLTREPGSTTDRSHAHCMWASVNCISWLKNKSRCYTEYPSMRNTFQSNPSMHNRVSYRVGGAWNSPPPPEILKLSMFCHRY